MANKYKVILLIFLAGLSVLLSTTIFALEIMLTQRRQ